MSRQRRIILPNYCYHFLNRGNRRATVFHDGQDYDAFLSLIREADARVSMPIIAACLMPNHVHLVLRPAAEGDLQAWSHWLFTTHASHYHAKYRTDGHVWQGRYKSIPVQHDRHLLILMRYVERNAFRARLVGQPEDWRWSSLCWRIENGAPIDLADSPVSLPTDWLSFVLEPQTAAELAEIRMSIAKERPYGDQEWAALTSDESGIPRRPRGRPRKK